MVWQTESATNAAHGGQCLAPCIVMFEKVGPASEWPLKKEKVVGAWLNSIRLGSYVDPGENRQFPNDV